MKSCNNSCESCRYLNRCGGCSSCEAMICRSKCEYCNSICKNKKGVMKYLESFGDFNITVKANNYSKLPIHIPIIPNKLIKPISSTYVSAHAGFVLSNNGEKIARRYLKNGCKEALNLKPETKMILEFYVKDKYIEGFWDERYEAYKLLRKMDFEYIISPNYSIYDDSTRIDHLYNIKRNTIVYNELLDIGLNVIPDVSWFNINDLDCWINEINKNKIKLVAFSFQNVGAHMRASCNWKRSLLGFRYFCSKISYDVDIILAGIVSPFRILEVYESIGRSNRLIILNQSAYIQGENGILSETRKPAPNLCINEVIDRNISYFDKIYAEIYKSNKLANLSNLPKEQLIKLYGRLRLEAKTIEDEYIVSFIFRCLRKKRVNEVVLFQSQEVLQYPSKK